MRPILELLFGEDRFEKFERRIFVRVTFHVEIDEDAKFSRAAQNRLQLWHEMRNCTGQIGRVHLRIERGNFDGKIHNREELGISAERIRPASCFAREGLQQIETTRGILVGLRFADDSFSQKIDSEADFLCAPLPQGFHQIVRIFSGDKLARHSGNIPAQDGPAYPRNDTRQTNTGVNKGSEAVPHIGEIFVEMLDNIARFAQRREDIDKAK